MYGNVSTANSKIAVDTDVAGGLYGAGNFGYSINSASAAVEEAAGAATSASIQYQNGINPSDYYSITKTLSGADMLGARAFRILSASADVTLPQYTTVSGNDVTFVIAKTATTVAVSYTHLTLPTKRIV